MSQTPAYADLEIRILPRGDADYPVEMTLDGDREFGPGYLDPAFLPWVPSADPAGDGERLFRWLTADDRIKAAWAEARGAASNRRVRLRIDQSAPELHAIPWELLREAEDSEGAEKALGADIAASSATPFSRYLAGRWQPGGPILQRPIKVLVAIADPDGLDEYGLQPIDADAEWAALKSALASLEVQLTRLPSPRSASQTASAQGSRSQIEDLEAELRRGGYHVLHFIGHGSFSQRAGQAVLYMPGADGQAQLVRDADLAGMLARQLSADQRQDERLRLVFLGSCQTATRSPADAFRGLAPQLVAAGVPAVVAMQDLVPVTTAQAFAATFYRQLLDHGLADLAANEARATLITAKLPGAAIPVLFMRVRGGQLLGQRGQILGDRAASFWSTLLENIADGDCTPFLGPGVTAGLLPGPVEVARQLAAEYSYPFSATQSLPRVAQFVGTLDNRRLRKEYVRTLVTGFKSRLCLPGDPLDRGRTLTEVIASSDWPRGNCQEMFETEIHGQLAGLGLPLYLTTNFDNFMGRALDDAGRPARRETVKWRETISRNAARPHFDLSPPPSPQNPVVLHLFGTDDDLLSMVLTEDDYLDYLARISRDYEYLLPTSVTEALASTTLLFLGYRLEDMGLRVIMRGLLTNLDLDRWGMLHVAVQIESEVADQEKLEEVTRYFQKYFSNSKIDVYWGSTQQFVADLHARWQEFAHG
jgi:hypothetical protein